MAAIVRERCPDVGRRLWQYLRACVQIDSRTLAVFRVFVGALVVADLFLRARNFSLFYTESGVVPRSLAMEHAAEYPFSIYYLTTNSTIIAALFVLQGLIALQLMVGYRTRIATVLTFLFVVSLDHHNPFVLSYADTLFRLLLFWAIFLPLGERWSVDAVHRERAARPQIASVASALILGQMVFMYFSNGLIKTQSDVWGTMDAAPLVLGLDEMTFLLGDVVREFTTLLGIGGLAWYYMLLASPLLILLRGRPRMILVGMFLAGHASFAITVRIGAFAYVAIAGVLLFCQSDFWRDARAVATRVGLDPSALAARTASLEGFARRFPNPHLGGQRLRRVRAVSYRVSVGIVVLTILFVSAVLLVDVAGVVVENDDRPIEERVDGTIEESMDRTGVSQVETAAESVGIDQPLGWGVFAGPDPRTTDRYYVFPAETESGERVDVYNERNLPFSEGVTSERPYDELQQQYGTYRERFYMNSVRRGSVFNDVPVSLGEHLCERWADEHDEELVSITMYEVTEEITMETIDRPADREQEVSGFYRHDCGE